MTAQRLAFTCTGSAVHFTDGATVDPEGTLCGVTASRQRVTLVMLATHPLCEKCKRSIVVATPQGLR